MTFPCGKGTLRFGHISKTFTGAFDPATCLLTETQTGRFTLSHGTGSYAAMHGSGTWALSIVGITKKNRAGQCTHVRAPATFQQITTANGTVSQ